MDRAGVLEAARLQSWLVELLLILRVANPAFR